MSTVLEKNLQGHLAVAKLFRGSQFAPDPDSPFFMSKEAWYDLQAYVQAATLLPMTQTAVAEYFDLGGQAPEFTKTAAEVFVSINEHCHTWQTETYPDVVEVANRIAQYATEFPAKASGLRQVVTRMGSAQKKGEVAEVERLFKTLDKLLQRYLQQARDNKSWASRTKDEIKEFADLTDLDRGNLVGLRKCAEAEVGLADKEIDKLGKKIDKYVTEIHNKLREYNKNVIVAATTPAYVLVGLLGLVAIAIVVPLAAAQTAKLKKEIEDLRAEAEAQTKEIQTKIYIKTQLDLYDQRTASIKEKAGKAQDVIDHARGIWETIEKDIGRIPGTLRNMIADGKDADTILMEMDLQTAEDEWSKVGSAADQFRVNAYVRFIAQGALEEEDQ